MILYSYTWSFNFSCPNIISKKLRLIRKKKKYLILCTEIKGKEEARADLRVQGEHLVCLLGLFFHCPCCRHLMLLLHG